MIHIVQPLQVYMLTQDIRWTLLIMFLFESFEAFTLTVCGGTYCLWNGGTIQCDGHVTDNLIADIIEGSLGIFLGVMFRTALRMPRWSINLREAYSTEGMKIFAKRVLMFILVVLTPILATLETTSGFVFGVGLYGLVLGAIIFLFAWWNQTTEERERFWTNSKGKFVQNLYWRCYLGWIVMDLALVFGGRYLPFSSTYFRVWTVWAVLWFILLLIGAQAGLLEQLIDLHSFSVYSIVTMKERARFLYDQYRFRKKVTQYQE
jgi:hypothetical protein